MERLRLDGARRVWGRNGPNFPTEGILFRDITPLLQNGEAFNYACEKIAEFAKSQGATVIVGPESRGFIFGCPVATKLNIGFAPVRKPGKLPRAQIKEEYTLEYGSNTLCMHLDSVKPGDKVLIVDDLLATGGTLKATCNIINKLGAEVVGISCLIELVDLNGKELLKDYPVYTLIKY